MAVFIGKCPKCDKFIGEIKVEAIEAKSNDKQTLKSVVYKCPLPLCGAILSVCPDPIAMLAELQKLLRTR
jgi:hypothetical protein